MKRLEQQLSVVGVILVSLYIGAQIIADVGATRLIEIGGVMMPGGTLIFALTFTLRDILHKQLWRKLTIVTIVMGAVVNVLLALYMLGIGQIPAPSFYRLTNEWGQVFAWVPSITLGSIAAEMLSQWVDTEVYELWVRRVTRRFQWSRVLVSNACGLVVDSASFGLLAFTFLPMVFGGDVLPIMTSLTLGAGQIVYKGLVTIISMPLIYTVKDGPGLA